MREEAVKLEKLRQQIEQAEFEAGDASDYIDRGKPSEKELKKAQELITRKNEKTKTLLVQLHTMLSNTPQDVLEEWVNWHENFLNPIMTETSDKVRLHVAKQTFDEWENVLARKQDFVRINWYYLKDYKAKVKDLLSG